MQQEYALELFWESGDKKMFDAWFKHVREVNSVVKWNEKSREFIPYDPYYPSFWDKDWAKEYLQKTEYDFNTSFWFDNDFGAFVEVER